MAPALLTKSGIPALHKESPCTTDSAQVFEFRLLATQSSPGARAASWTTATTCEWTLVALRDGTIGWNCVGAHGASLLHHTLDPHQLVTTEIQLFRSGPRKPDFFALPRTTR